jgi:hypothetical protein
MNYGRIVLAATAAWIASIALGYLIYQPKTNHEAHEEHEG